MGVEYGHTATPAPSDRRSTVSPNETSSEITHRWAYGSEAADGRGFD